MKTSPGEFAARCSEPGKSLVNERRATDQPTCWSNRQLPAFASATKGQSWQTLQLQTALVLVQATWMQQQRQLQLWQQESHGVLVAATNAIQVGCVCFVSALRYPLSLCVLCGLCGWSLPWTIPDHSVTCYGVNNTTEARANPCSYLFLWYMNGIVSLGHSRTITQEDIDSQWPVRPGDDAATMQDRFGKLWREQKQRPK